MQNKLIKNLQIFIKEFVRYTTYNNGLASVEKNMYEFKGIAENRIKRFVISLVILSLVLPMLIIGIIFLLIALFFYLSELHNYVYPALICGLVPLTLSFIILIVKAIFK